MLRILRFVAFVPAALIASVVAGWIGHRIGSFFGFGIFGGEQYLAWILSGLGSSAAFLLVGMNAAPEASETVKWILLLILFLLGLMACIGPVVVDRNPVAALAGAVMVLVAISTLKARAEDFKLFK